MVEGPTLAPAPQNLEAEENVLGAIFLSPSTLDTASSILSAADFYRPSHGLIFQAALALSERGVPPDPITVSNELDKDGHLDSIGGAGRLRELAALVPASANIAHYAHIVRELAGTRALLTAGQNITRLAIERPGDVPELIEQAEAELSKAVDPTISTHFEPLADALDPLLDDIREAHRTGNAITGILTGFPDLDAALTGLHPGQVILIAARPGYGKSALALNIAENVADDGRNVALLSLEMSKREIGIRSLSRASGLDSQRIRTGNNLGDGIVNLGDAVKVVKGRTSLYIEDSTAVTPTTLRAEIRRLHRQHNLSLVIIDYLQLMMASDPNDSRQHEVAAISRSLKLLARDLDIPIIALSQLNRKLDFRQEKRPQLADLRDSGALEQDADVVIFLYRDEMENPDSQDKGIAEIIVRKNRMGPQGTVRLAYVSHTTTFKSLAKGVAP